jgi:hypothetical protein
MAYKYGTKAVVKDSIGQLPVSVIDCVVYFGCAYGSSAHVGEAVKCVSYRDYINTYHGGNEPGSRLALDDAAKIAFDKVGIDHAWFVNVAASVTDESSVDNDDIASILDDSLASICLNTSERPNILCVPAIQAHAGTLSDLVTALASICDGKINDSYSAIAVLDVAESADQVSASGKAVPDQISKDTTDGHIISCWGRVISERNANGTVKSADYLSSVISAMYAAQDAKNTSNVPYRSIGNLNISWAKGLCIYAMSGGGSPAYFECTARQSNMTDICAKGVTTICNHGNQNITTWGDHTSAFSDGGTFDALYQFDSGVRMMIYLFNGFIDRWRGVIDDPMDLDLRNSIVTKEQENLDRLVLIKALIGNPKCEFRPENNTEIGLGYFYFSSVYTTVIPAKYIEMDLSYTTEGLKAYTEAA